MKAEMRALTMIALAALLLAGCGQKGPLYMPADSQGENAAMVSETASDDTNDQTGESTPVDAAPDAPEDES
ncbi:MAG: lipoprotein [Onishia taeanensis]|uniref:LPS translocon maturation chaperone LptM n=1 Tax=Onishia taeanensis TaxID=284577 RepID=UPI003C7B66E5